VREVITDGVPGLEQDRGLLGRTSIAEGVADILRTRIAEGYFPPGARLVEQEIVEKLKISRNTLREAFRLLTHERLLSHELNRGVFVRLLTLDDVIDLYRVRKMVECAAVRSVGAPPALDVVRDAVEAGDKAEAAGDWQGLGTANIAFHRGLCALGGSARIDDLMKGVFAELRLVFHVMADPRRFYEPYLARNHEILTALSTGDGPATADLLAAYLDDSERQLVDAYAERAAIR
jgi:DNA-binding GntR family transcriptional regulator